MSPGPKSGVRTRRMHTEEFKAEIVRQCRGPGVSVSGVALAHGLNANLVRNWLNGVGVRAETDEPKLIEASKRTSAPSFIGLPIGALPVQSIHVELVRGSTRICVDWPVSAAEAAAAWLRDVAR